MMRVVVVSAFHHRAVRHDVASAISMLVALRLVHRGSAPGRRMALYRLLVVFVPLGAGQRHGALPFALAVSTFRTWEGQGHSQALPSVASDVDRGGAVIMPSTIGACALR